MKTKLFIDFDGTLYNTTKSRDEMFLVFLKIGFSIDEILSAYQAECLNYKFTSKGLIERLYKIRKFNLPLAYARIENITAQTNKYLYEDTPFFKRY